MSTGSRRVPRPSAPPAARSDTRPVGTSDLVEAKLTPPQLRPTVVPREALVLRLLHADEPVVALMAPAGYGKSTALALWRVREPRPVAWLTADAADADPARFLAHLSAAIARATGLDLGQLDRLIASGASAISIVVPRLSTLLFRAGARLVVMIDDVHRIGSQGTTDAIAMVIDYLPPGMTVVLAGRGDAGLPLHRFRASGRLLEVSAADLAFDAAESARLADLAGRPLAAEDAHALQVATEGWPAAVYLALRRGAAVARAKGGGTIVPTGRDTEIATYLDAELLHEATPRARAFMLRTSVLERMTADLCDAVVGRRDSDRVLRALADRSQLVERLDAQGTWYRYHPLVREHLGALLAREPGGAGPYHRQAARWYASRGMDDAAVDHLLEAGDREGAAAHMSAILLRLYRGGRVATILGWLEQLGREELARQPFVAAFATLALALAGRSEAAQHMADIADGATYDLPRPPGAEAFEGLRAANRALLARGGMAAARADAEAAVALVPRRSEWWVVVAAIRGLVESVAGDPDLGDALLRDVATTARSERAARALAIASAWHALRAIDARDWEVVDRLVRDGLASAEQYLPERDATAVAMLVVAALAAIHRGDPVEARRHVADFQIARTSLGEATPWLSVRCLLDAARVYLALSDPAGARSCLAQAGDIVARRPDLGHLPSRLAALREQIRNLPPGPGGASTLTPAEIRVLRLLPTYLTAPEMASRLYVSTNTVRTQIQSVYGKLGATSRGEAVELAVQAGLLEPLPVLAREGPDGTGDRITSS